jgi:hypothetical protein
MSDASRRKVLARLRAVSISTFCCIVIGFTNPNGILRLGLFFNSPILSVARERVFFAFARPLCSSSPAVPSRNLDMRTVRDLAGLPRYDAICISKHFLQTTHRAYRADLTKHQFERNAETSQRLFDPPPAVK